MTALAGYAVSEADVRLEVARLYPDLEIGPGFIWDQGVNRWTLALALPALLGLRQRGALHEAEAARNVAAARVAEAQDSIVMQVEAAAAGCRGAGLGVIAADSQVVTAHALAERDRARYARGETARLEPARSALLLARAERGPAGGPAAAGVRRHRPGGGDRRMARCPQATLARSQGGAPDSMSRRFGIVLVLLVLAAVAAGVLLRPERRATGEAREAPIVAPSRVVEESGEARVVLDSAEVARVGIGLAALTRADRNRGAPRCRRGCR